MLRQISGCSVALDTDMAEATSLNRQDAQYIRRPTIHPARYKQYNEPKIMKIITPISIIASCVTLSACASTYGNLVSGSNLGAQEYQPSVYAPTPEAEAKYQQILPICRQVAVSRQITASEQAQLASITGTVSGLGEGAAAGAEFGAIFRSAGLDGMSIGKAAGLGAAAGLVGSLVDSFTSGTQEDAAATRRILLRCLRVASKSAGYTVLESDN